jgi:hypothetical protein
MIIEKAEDLNLVNDLEYSYESLIDPNKVKNNVRDFFNLFDGIYVINLKERKDRLNLFSLQMKETGVDFKVVEAYDGKLHADKVAKDPMYLLDQYSDICDVKPLKEKMNLKNVIDLPGVYACAESHRKAVMTAMNDGCKSPLIFEDDSCPTQALFYQGSQMAKELKETDYDIVNMGIGGVKFTEDRGYFNPGSELVKKLQKGTLTKFHAYTLNSRFYLDFLKYSLKSWCEHVDIQVTKESLRNKKEFYAIHPRPFTQLGDYSSIQQKVIRKGGTDEVAFRFPRKK